MNPWPHQLRAEQAVLDASEAGHKRIAMWLPTGAGKTLVLQRLARRVLDAECKVALYSNRRYLIEQLSASLDEAGIRHGVRSAEWDEDEGWRFQVCSIATEHSRVVKRGLRALHAAGPGDLAIFDEAHLHTGDVATELMKRHLAGGASVLLNTATPFGLVDHADVLVGGATMAELRECGAHVPVRHYGPDEPDFTAFKALRQALERGDNPSEAQLAKAYPRTPALFGRVWHWFNEINPTRRPTLAIGPDVQGSLWMAEQFTAKGVPAAHVDGEDIWTCDGGLQKSTPELREAIRDGSRTGRYVVVSNRFCLREGIDWPWLSHLIQPAIGSLQSYLQSGGRGMRAYPGKEYLSVQDHGGNYHRHGSLMEDRCWGLDCTEAVMHGMRIDRLRQKKEREPFRCPQCGRVWVVGKVCNEAWGGCGFVFPEGKRSRPVVSTDGTMKEVSGDIYRARSICKQARGPAIWERMYYRSLTEKGAKTFVAAEALFAVENYFQYPDRRWPFMPTDERDLFRLVSDVPRERLIQKPKE
jgi:superfamily II DNA or RNA helicase